MSETRPPYVTAAPPILPRVACCPCCGVELGNIAIAHTVNCHSVHPLTLGGVHLFYAAGWCANCGYMLRWSMKAQRVSKIERGVQLVLGL